MIALECGADLLRNEPVSLRGKEATRLFRMFLCPLLGVRS